MARTPIATDNFNRASLGADWAQLNSDWGNILIVSSTSVYGNAAALVTGNSPAARWVGAGTFTADQYAEITIQNLSNLAGGSYFVGVIVRASADTGTGRDFYAAAVDYDGSSGASMTTRLVKVVNGTGTSLHSAAVTWSNGDKLSLEVEGTTLRVCKNGTALGGSFTQTDTDLATGVPGIVAAGGSTVYGDDWEGGNISSASVSITSVSDSDVYNGQTGITITGTGFGATETGSAAVIISPTDNVADASAVTQDVTSWSATSLEFTATRGSLAYNTTMYLFVKESGGVSNAAGTAISFHEVVTTPLMGQAIF